MKIIAICYLIVKINMCDILILYMGGGEREGVQC